MTRLLHPRHGPHEPVAGSPRLGPGTARRTSTVDTVRPEGPRGPAVMTAHGRDAVAGATGVRVADSARVTVVVDSGVVTSLDAVPSRPGLDALVGRRLGSGFRAAVDAAVPAERDAASVLYLLLDDLPVAALVSGHAVAAAGVYRDIPPEVFLAQADLCAGWAADATIITEVRATGQVPGVTGPPAPPLVNADDPGGWHDLPDLPRHGMRRSRRTDVHRAGDVLVVDSHFRDSHRNGDGLEVVVHEYSVAAEVTAGVVTRCAATARVLPWVECPAAVASAGRLGGVRAAELRRHVRGEFTGTSTCTHLNDQLRSLADVAALAALLG